MGRFYLTTPIYYVNDKPHIGHAYTTVLADVLAGYRRLFGDETFFLTGTDEHGLKVAQAAKKGGLDPKTHCDLTSARFRDAWKALGIRYDHFLRTTDEEHKRFVTEQLAELHRRGEVYETEYEGWYSTSEERFFTEKELVDGKDPVSGRPVERIREKNYFFKMSKWQDALRRHIEEHPGFIQPESRRNEVLGFLRQPLADLCISRPKSRVDWGIPLPFDPEYTAYVWVDALLNYWSAVATRPWADGTPRWPADLHLVGKDILTTHAVYWMTLLMALGAPLPKTLLAHGWWMVDEARMSKTTGNVVDPLAMAAEYGVDSFRYYLMRDMAVGSDASFSEEGLVAAHNADLANDLGNLYSRAHRLVTDHFEARVPEAGEDGDAEKAVRAAQSELVAAVCRASEEYRPDLAIAAVSSFLRLMNRYVDGAAPWKKIKTDRAAAGAALHRVLDGLATAAALLSPVIPEKADRLLGALGLTPTAAIRLGAGHLAVGHALPPAETLFPRREWTREDHRSPAVAAPAAKAQNPAREEASGVIGIEDFAKVRLVAAVILTAEAVAGTDKLVALQVDAGEDKPRSVVAGIRASYDPAVLPGKKVLLVANLAPRKLRGIESHGMLLCAKVTGAAGEKLVLLAPEADVPPGAPVS